MSDLLKAPFTAAGAAGAGYVYDSFPGLVESVDSQLRTSTGLSKWSEDAEEAKQDDVLQVVNNTKTPLWVELHEVEAIGYGRWVRGTRNELVAGGECELPGSSQWTIRVYNTASRMPGHVVLNQRVPAGSILRWILQVAPL